VQRTPEPRRAPAAVDLPVPERVAALARAGAVALLAAFVIPVLASSYEGWNLFAVLSPFEAGGMALATWWVARALNRGRISASFAAGVLIAFGALTSVASLALIKFSLERLDAPATVLVAVVLAGAVAILVAGLTCMRSASASVEVTPADPGTLILGLGGVALSLVAMFVAYDGASSLWSEVGEVDSAEFAFEPLVAVAVMLAGLISLGTRPRFACALLLAAGAAGALHFLGVIIAAWRAIGEVGEIRPGGFIGLVGGLLIVAAGAATYRATKAAQLPTAVADRG
jgi:hypothetical protein